MGVHASMLDPFKAAALRNRAPILVVAGEAHLEPLRRALADAPPGGFSLMPTTASDAVAPSLFANASLAVIEVEPDDRESLHRIAVIRERYPHLPVVAAIQGASVALARTLVREGISDVVALPFEPGDLVQVALDVLARCDTEAEPDTGLAPLIAVTRSIGGCGATSIATHLAADLAAQAESGRGAVIVDLDLQFGSVADYLGVHPKGSIADLLAAPDRLDAELVASVSGRTGGGVTVIGAPEEIMPLESVSTDDLLRLLRMLRQHFDHVVLDLPANWTNWALSAALAADAVVLVTELSVASLRQAKRRLELFHTVGIEDSRIAIVVNRVEKRLFRTIGLADVAAALRHPVMGSITLDAPLVSTAQDQGELVGSLHRRSKFARDIAELGRQLRSSLQKGSH